MLRIIVDSGSSIKQEEKEKYGVDIVPLRYLMGDEEYRDGIDLSIDEFYKLLIEKKFFPKTSLPNLEELKELVDSYTKAGDDVVIVTISSGISGTFSAFTQMFADYSNVRVIDSYSAVGGVKIIVNEINKMKDKSLDEIVEAMNKLARRIRIFAIPETLSYLLRGGRLSKKEWLLGTMLNIKPIITIKQSFVKVASKAIGLKKAMKAVVDALKIQKCDKNYPIVPSYTYNKDNLDKLIEMTDDDYKSIMTEYDNLDPVIACHWGPNAFGYIFVGEDEYV
jgi:DegV family protein with EDD domain